MLVVTGEFRFEPGKDDALRAAMVDMMNESAKEAGCHHYRFYRDVENPEVYRVYEEWESDAAPRRPRRLRAHEGLSRPAEGDRRRRAATSRRWKPVRRRSSEHGNQVRIQFTLFSAFYSPLIATMAGGFLKRGGIGGGMVGGAEGRLGHPDG